jgi:hypothetical protein
MPTYWEPCPGKRKATRAIVHLKLKKLNNYFTSKSPASEAKRGGFSALAKIFLKPEPLPKPFQALRVDKALKVRLF